MDGSLILLCIASLFFMLTWAGFVLEDGVGDVSGNLFALAILVMPVALAIAGFKRRKLLSGKLLISLSALFVAAILGFILLLIFVIRPALRNLGH